MTTTTSRSWRWLTPAARSARMRELVAAHGWRLSTDEPRGHLREWQGDAGLRVGWLELHQHGARALWVEADDEATRDAVLESLSAELPTWSDEALRRDAHVDDLHARLLAVRVWCVAATTDASLLPGLSEALIALARHEHPVARLAALDISYVAKELVPEPILALARERAEQDLDFAEPWQQLVAMFDHSESK
jgi:hypothetical protein